MSCIIEPRLQTFNDSKVVILDYFSKKDKSTAGRGAILIQVLWSNINNVIWNDERDEVTQLDMQAYHT